MKEIKVTPDKIALVDDEDFDKVSQYSWHYNGNHAQNSKVGMMHRYILNMQKGEKWIDHKDNNGLNNQKNNLRFCTRQENTWNAKPRRIGTGYKGVRQRGWGKYQAIITKDGQLFRSEKFNSLELAALAYDKMAKELFGEFAYLNFKE